MSNDYPIHIVDDDPDVRASVKRLVQRSGYPAHVYADAQEFLRLCGEANGCVLVDLRLEGMDGLELLRQMKACHATLDAMMISAYGDIKRAVEAMRLGAVDFLEKPYDPDDLLDRIRALSKTDDSRHRLQHDAMERVALLDTLTSREREVLEGIVDGQSNKRVALNLGISPRTVETHRENIMQKLQADSLAYLVRIWLVATNQPQNPDMNNVG